MSRLGNIRAIDFNNYKSKFSGNFKDRQKLAFASACHLGAVDSAPKPQTLTR